MMNNNWRDWLPEISLLLILALGIYFRFVGLNWDENNHLHPDERFLTMVASSISSVSSLGEYFNSAVSTLNPNNVGFGFFVYGDFPLIVIRYIAESFSQTGYDQIFLVGRQLSALADVLTILLVYLIGSRLYQRWVGVIAAAFAAFSVVPIQQAHFFTVDTFANLFGFLAVYLVVRFVTAPDRDLDDGPSDVTLQGRPALLALVEGFPAVCAFWSCSGYGRRLQDQCSCAGDPAAVGGFTAVSEVRLRLAGFQISDRLDLPGAGCHHFLPDLPHSAAICL